jgi:hypothetical protein
VTLPRSSLRRSQGRADHRTRTPRYRGRSPGLEWSCGWAASPTVASSSAIPEDRWRATGDTTIPEQACSSCWGAENEPTNAPFHRDVRPRGPASRPEPLRESNAPRYSSVRLRAPSTAESRRSRRSFRAATTPSALPPRASLPTRFRALRCALGTRPDPEGSERRASCRSPASFNRTTTSTPRASTTPEKSHWPAAPPPGDKGRALNVLAPASRFIPFEG